MSTENSENKRIDTEDEAVLSPVSEEDAGKAEVVSEESVAVCENFTCEEADDAITEGDTNEESNTSVECDTTEECDTLEGNETPMEILVSEENMFYSQHDYDEDMYFSPELEPRKAPSKLLRSVYDFVEMMIFVTIAIVLCFTFVFRLNIVDGPSMENTLHTGEYLLVSDLFYEATPGDIVVIQDMAAKAEAYRSPIVKRIIAVGGQTVDIDFKTWTLTVDGEVVDESSYRYLASGMSQSTLGYISFPVTLEEGEVFVMGDNRYYSADSRLAVIGLIDERCIVGKVYARIFPFKTFTVFKNPYKN